MTQTAAHKLTLNRVSSPHQLDQAMRVNGPLYWTSMLAILAGLVAAVIWACTGSIPTKSVGEGSIMRPGGMISVSAAGSGFVSALHVQVGDHVNDKQVIAEIDQPSSDDDIRALQEHLAELRSQTTESVALRQDTAKLQDQSLDLQRDNARREVADQQKMEKMATDEVATNEQLYSKGLITHQPVVDSQQRLLSIQSTIGRLRTEISQADSQAFQANWQPEMLKRQRDLEIHDLEQRITGPHNDTRITSNVVSPVRGEVVEERIYAGSLVATGTPVVSIEPETDQVVAVIYVPSETAKDIKEGMDAEISPSNAKREEYGFLRGKVSSVAHYPATTSGMMTLFENDALVTSLRGRGMVTEVDISLEHAEDTPSNFRWSSSRGPDMQITPGTLCSAQIITRTQKPITLVFPFLKKLVGLH